MGPSRTIQAGQFENLAVGQSATDTFSYTISDGNGGTDTASVTVTVTGENDSPVAVNDSIATNEDTPVLIEPTLLLANDTDVDDGDVLTIVSVDSSSTTGLVIDNGDGTFSYDPNGQFESLAVGESHDRYVHLYRQRRQRWDGYGNCHRYDCWR